MLTLTQILLLGWLMAAQFSIPAAFGTGLVAWQKLPTLLDAAGLGAPCAGVSSGRLLVADDASFPQAPLGPGEKTWYDTVYALSKFLDEALDRLSRKERDALVLRFFEQRSLAEVATALGATEGAARKRVNRALEKVRTDLVRRGVATTGSALAAAISVRAVQVAPVGLAPSLAAASLAGAVAGTGTLLTAFKLLVMTKLKVKVVGAVVAGERRLC
jgi:hypothetical protein